MHRREFLRNAFGLAAIIGAVAAVATPAQAATTLTDPIAPPNKDGDREHEKAASQTDALDDDQSLEVSGRRGGRGRGRGWGFGRRGWGRRRRVRRGWYRRRRWSWYRRRRWRRRWWGWRRRRWWRPRRRRVYYY
jgi:hypothetical protein